MTHMQDVSLLMRFCRFITGRADTRDGFEVIALADNEFETASSSNDNNFTIPTVVALNSMIVPTKSLQLNESPNWAINNQ